MVRPGDVRQWRFRATATQLRAGVPVAMHNDAVDLDLELGSVRLPGPAVLRLPADPATGPEGSPAGDRPRTLTRAEPVTVQRPPGAEAISLHRPGSSPRPICGGERVAVRLADVGYLAAGEPGSADVVVRPEPAAEWVVTGVAPGVAVPVGRPVGLFDAVHGDHLVCIPPRAAPDQAAPDQGKPVLGWASHADGRAATLPIPAQLRPAEGVPGDTELSGALVPVRDGDLEAGLLLLLDPTDGRSLGSHLLRRVPELAEELAPDAVVGAIACRWSAAGGPSDADPPLPPAGSRLWAHGVLVADPGVSLNPVRALAWALDADGDAVTGGPGGPGWPETVITWRVLVLPLPDDEGGDPAECAFYLPLPGRDGEPGTATTLTPVSGRGAGRYAERLPGGRAPASPALVTGVSCPRRVLRMAVAPGHRPTALGCTVRVHLPGSTYGGVAPSEVTA